MAKLYAKLINSNGKEVSLSSNEEIKAVLYEGNKKVYEVSITYGDIGDIIDDAGNVLPDSKRTFGSTLSYRDYRKELQTLTEKMRKEAYEAGYNFDGRN